MPSDTGFIDDGYTIQGRIRAEEGYHPVLQFEFRPMLQREIVQHAGRIRKIREKPGASETEAAKLIASRVTWWDLRNSKGAEVQITEENASRLEPHLFSKLYNIILNQAPPKPLDEDEEESSIFDEDQSAGN